MTPSRPNTSSVIQKIEVPGVGQDDDTIAPHVELVGERLRGGGNSNTHYVVRPDTTTRPDGIILPRDIEAARTVIGYLSGMHFAPTKDPYVTAVQHGRAAIDEITRAAASAYAGATGSPAGRLARSQAIRSLRLAIEAIESEFHTTRKMGA
jgi:hypothetical protein